MTTHREVAHVGDEDVHLDDLLDTGAGGGEYRLKVLNASGGLLLDRALDQVTLGVTGDLTGAVDGGGGLDGLGLWCGAGLVSTNTVRERERALDSSGQGSGVIRRGQQLCLQSAEVNWSYGRASTHAGQLPWKGWAP